MKKYGAGYNNEKILEDWKFISHHYENFDFEHFDDKKQISNLIEDLEPYFNIPILSLFEVNEDIYQNVKEIRELFQNYKEVFSYSDSEKIKENLEVLWGTFDEFENIQFYVELNRKTEQQFRVAERIRDDKSAQNREKYSIGQLDKEFSNEYDIISNWIFFKQLAFCILTISSLFIMVDIFKTLSIKDSVDLYGLFFMKIVIYTPFLILILFLLGQIKQDRQILQTYLHKKVIARSYINYAHTLNDRNFGIDDSQLKIRMQEMLLQTIIDVLKENPVSSLDKGNDKSGINSQTVIEKLIDKIPSIKN